MTANLKDLYRAINELIEATDKVKGRGWDEAQQLSTAIQQNLAALATGRDKGDDITTARMAAHHTGIECLSAYSEASNAPGRPELQQVFVEYARLLSSRLFDVRQRITVRRS